MSRLEYENETIPGPKGQQDDTETEELLEGSITSQAHNNPELEAELIHYYESTHSTTPPYLEDKLPDTDG